MSEPMTINTLFDRSMSAHPQQPALGMAFKDPVSYEGLGRRIQALAALLTGLGVQAGERLAILAENSPQWGIAYLATLRIGAVAVPILPDFRAEDILHILREADVRLLFCSSRQLKKIETDEEMQGIEIISLEGLEERLHGIEGEAGPTWTEPGAEDLAAIIYTSGTSGHSKAVMLSHKSICANVASATTLLVIEPHWTFLSLLPLSHTYECTLGFLLPLSLGAKVVYPGRTPTPALLEKVCAHERPQAIIMVPLIIEKIYKKRVMATLEANRLLRLLIKVPLFRRLLFRKAGAKLHGFFGGRLQVLAIGGAALNPTVEGFLRQAGLPFLAGYGLTETAPLLAAGPLGSPTITTGSVGKPVPGVEIRISSPDSVSGRGEILARGENIMLGYYQRPDLTDQTIDPDGWLATGDLGRLDKFGNLHVLGRSKSVIVLSHGENVFPEPIEERINGLVEVADCLVVERKDKLVALVHLDQDLLEQRFGGDVQARSIWLKLFLADIRESLNRDLPQYSKLYKVEEQQEPFVKTATHKIKRYLY